MKYYACLIPKEDGKIGLNVGRYYTYQHRREWVDASGIDTFLAAGYVKGGDHFTYNNKAYIIMKSFIDLNEKFVVVVAIESTNGCDIDPVEE